MNSTAEYALMAAAAYWDIRGLDNGKPLESNRAPIPPGWTILTAYDVKGSGGASWDGFSARVFKGPGGQIVISYAGTEFGSGKPLIGTTPDFLFGNMPLAAGVYGTQAMLAAELYQRVKAEQGGDISFTGHSLGGGLASMMAVWFKRPAKVFAQAPFQASADVTQATRLASLPATLLLGPAGKYLLPVFYRVQAQLAIAGPVDAEMSNYNPATDFAAREVNVQAWAIKGELLESSLGGFNWIEQSSTPLYAVPVNSLDAGSKHSIDLHVAALLVDNFQVQASKIGTALTRLMDPNLYGGQVTGTSQLLLSKLLRNEVGVIENIRDSQGVYIPGDLQIAPNGMLSSFARDLGKIAPFVSYLSVAAQDSILAQTMEWYYYRPSGYSFQEFINLDSGVLQFSPVAGTSLLDPSKSRALTFSQLWGNNLDGGAFSDSLKVQIDFVNYEQWNITGTNAGSFAVARDNSKRQLFVGNAGADQLVGSDKADFLWGGAGNDSLTGGMGNDKLYGGQGNDTYRFLGTFNQDEIIDSDGVGSIELNGITLNGGKSSGKPNIWVQMLGTGDYVGYQLFQDASSTTGYRLAIARPGNEGSIIINNFDRTAALSTSGYLGIRLDNSARIALVQGTGSNPFLNQADAAGEVASATQVNFNERGASAVTVYLATPAAAGDSLVLSLAGVSQLSMRLGGQATGAQVVSGTGSLTVALKPGQTEVVVLLDEPEKLATSIASQLTATYSTTVEGVPSTVARGLVVNVLAANATTFVQVGTGIDDALYVAAPAVDYTGNAGNDLLGGNIGADYLNGGVGDDLLGGGAGSDTLIGGDGNDFLFGSRSALPFQLPLATIQAQPGYAGIRSAGYSGVYTLWAAVDKVGSVWGTRGYNNTYYGIGDINSADRNTIRDVSADDRDYLDGGAGDDVLEGGIGGDYLLGGTGSDMLYGGLGADKLFGGTGNDLLIGDNSDIDFNQRASFLDPTRHGADYLDGGDGNDTIFGQGKADVLYGGLGDDTLFGDDYVDKLAANFHGDDSLNGGAGNDRLIGGGGADYLEGGAGNDYLWGDQPQDFTNGSTGVAFPSIPLEFQGDDTLDGGDGNDVLAGGGGNDYLIGGAGDDYLSGDAGNDWLIDGLGDDTLYGGAGSDYLSSEAGDDYLLGGMGNDTYYVFTDANDPLPRQVVIDDTGGRDTLVLTGIRMSDLQLGVGASTSPDLVLVANNTTIFIKNGLLNSIENLSLSGGGTTLRAAVQSLSSQTASTSALSSTPSALQTDTLEDLITQGLQTALQRTSPLPFPGEERVVLGSAKNDTIRVAADDVRLRAGRGDDLIAIDGNNSTLSYKAGDGIDTLSAFSAGTGIRIALGEGFTRENTRLALTPSGVVQLVFSSNVAERINLGFLSRNDLATSNRIAAVEFSDGSSVSFQALLDQGVVLENTGLWNDLYGTDVGDKILGGVLDERVLAGAGDDYIDAGAGVNNLYGEQGDDFYVVSIPGATYRVDDNVGRSTVYLKNFSSLADAVITRVGATLRIELADNTVVELVGAFYNAGSYQVLLANGQLLDYEMLVSSFSGLTIQATSLADVLQGSQGNDYLFGSFGNDVLRGMSGNDLLLGGYDDDTYLIEAGGGIDSIIDNHGVNRIRFGLGINRSAVQASADPATGNLTLSYGGTNSVTIANGMNGLVSFIEFGNGETVSIADFLGGLGLTSGPLLGTLGADTLYGTLFDDLIEGDAGKDLLVGGNGNDHLDGGEGIDTLVGGLGADTMEGGLGEDIYTFALGDGVDKVRDPFDLSTISFGAGIAFTDINSSMETVNGIEHLRIQYSPTDAVLIEDGLERDFSVQFSDGVSLTRDELLLNALPGSGVSIEGGFAGQTIYGRGGNDVLLGGRSDDVLYGGGGNDLLNGLGGRDVLEGGAGVDTYVLASGGGHDIIKESDGGLNILRTSVNALANLSFVRVGQALKVMDSAGQASSLIVGFFADLSATWQIEIAGGVDFNLRSYVQGLNLESVDSNIVSQADRDRAYAALPNLYSPALANFSSGGFREGVSRNANVSQLRNTISSDLASISLTSQDYVNRSFNATAVVTTRTYVERVPIYAAITTRSNPSQTIATLPAEVGGVDLGGSLVNGGSIVSTPNADGTITLGTRPSSSSGLAVVGFTSVTKTETVTSFAVDTLLTSIQRVDELIAGASNNQVSLSGGSKIVDAGAGDDVIRRYGDESLNAFYGSISRFQGAEYSESVTYGRPFSDFVSGGDGNDRIELGQGNDQLIGGAGDDFLSGGTGSDVYVVASVNNGFDVIFDRGQDYFWLTAFGKSITTDKGIQGPAGAVAGIAYRYGFETYRVSNASHNFGVSDETVLLNDQTIQGIRELAGLSQAYRSHPYRGDLGISTNLPFIPAEFSPSKDVIRFDAGVIPADLSFTWINTTVEGLTYPALSITWGSNSGIKVVMPRDLYSVDFGIEFYEFSNGTKLTSDELLALAPPRPPANSGPLLLGSAVSANDAVEDSAFVFQVPVDAFAVAAGRTIEYRASLADGEVLPAWLSFNSSTRTFSGTPSNYEVGNLQVAYFARDMATGQELRQEFAISVQNTNDAPAATGTIAQIVVDRENPLNWIAPFSQFSDVDLVDRLTYRLELGSGEELPAWMQFSRSSGLLTGTPANTDVGVYQLRLVATDPSGASAAIDFSLDVKPMNRAPIIGNPLLDLVVEEEQAILFTVPITAFNDPDLGDALSYSATLATGTPLPLWLTFHASTRTFSGTPPNTASGVQNIRVTATDTSGLSVFDDFDLKVLNLIKGTDLNNTLTGTAADDVIYGLAGADTLTGGLGADRLIGGLGNDTYNVDNIGDTVIELDLEGTDKVNASVSFSLSGFVENLTLTGNAAINGTGNDLVNAIVGNSAANVLDGGAGNDTLTGGDGDDTLIGGEGNDSLVGGLGADAMRGGLGDDSYTVDNVLDVVVELAAEGTDKVTSSVTFSLGANLENLTLTGTDALNGFGNDLNNAITGNAGANTLDGGLGNDTLVGGDGNDRLIGGDGTDSLNGGLGADVMLGGLGNDTYTVDDIGDTVTELLGEGTDKVNASVTYALTANVENLTLTGLGNINGIGNDLANTLTGNVAANTLDGGLGNDSLSGGDGDDVLIGGEGNDSLTGGLGNDVMRGGVGDDSYTVDSTLDVITELVSEGTDKVTSSVTYTLVANVENLTLSGVTDINGMGNELANAITGNAGANILSGGTGNDTLSGGDGADVLIGGEGNDALNGGLGADAMAGGLGDDVYTVDSAGDVVTESLNEGIDRVNASISYTLGANVENLTLTGTDVINGIGNDLNNTITGNTAANTLEGMGGNDSLSGGDSNDMLLGGDGTDTLTGGAGDDVLDGGAGADALNGGMGSDLYKFGRGYGLDKISENDLTPGNTDTLQFLAGVSADQILFKKVGNNLELGIVGTVDKLTVSNWYLGSQYHVEQFKTADGKTLLDSQVQNLVNAMASIVPPPLGQTSLSAAQATALSPVIAANWQ
jgi:trimeric autotransporter adhesin